MDRNVLYAAIDTIKENATKIDIDKGENVFDKLLSKMDEDTRAGILKNSGDIYGVRHVDSPFQVSVVVLKANTFSFCIVNPFKSVSTAMTMKSLSMMEAAVHSHDHAELTYIVQGNVQLKIDNEVFQLSEGEFCLMGREVEHTELFTTGSYKALYISISDSFLREALLQNGIADRDRELLYNLFLDQPRMFRMVRFVPNLLSQVAETESVVLRFIEELNAQKAGSKYILQGYIVRFLAGLNVGYSVNMLRAEKKEFRQQLAKDIVIYIETHAATVTIQELKEIYHYNADYFSRLLQKYIGKSYTEILQDARLHQASQYLTTTDLSISTLARNVGYSNVGYFYKRFEQKYGVKPNEYRLQFKKQ